MTELSWRPVPVVIRLTSSTESATFRRPPRPSSLLLVRILVAEDEKKIASFLRKALQEASYAVDEVHDGNSALECAINTPYDAIILDVMMPGRDGLSVLKLMRAQRIETPVLLLTARGEVSERIEGLELGADDYMAKPFAMRELLARVS